jgi:hypothetical protein
MKYFNTKDENHIETFIPAQKQKIDSETVEKPFSIVNGCFSGVS